MFERLPLDEFGNRIPPITAEIAWTQVDERPIRELQFLAGGGIFAANTFQLGSGMLDDRRHRFPWTHLDIDPGDVVTIALDDGRSFEVRVLKVDIGANLELAWDTLVQESSTYDVAALTSGGLTYRRAFVPPTPETRLLLADSPLLADGDDALRLSSGIYWAIGGIGQPGWSGGVLLESRDGGASRHRRPSTATSRSSRASPHPGPPPWCGAGTPIRSASCAHGTKCLRSWAAHHPQRPPRPAPAWLPS